MKWITIYTHQCQKFPPGWCDFGLLPTMNAIKCMSDKKNFAFYFPDKAKPPSTARAVTQAGLDQRRLPSSAWCYNPREFVNYRQVITNLLASKHVVRWPSHTPTLAPSLSPFPSLVPPHPVLPPFASPFPSRLSPFPPFLPPPLLPPRFRSLLFSLPSSTSFLPSPLSPLRSPPSFPPSLWPRTLEEKVKRKKMRNGDDIEGGGRFLLFLIKKKKDECEIGHLIIYVSS